MRARFGKDVEESGSCGQNLYFQLALDVEHSLLLSLGRRRKWPFYVIVLDIGADFFEFAFADKRAWVGIGEFLRRKSFFGLGSRRVGERRVRRDIPLPLSRFAVR